MAETKDNINLDWTKVLSMIGLLLSAVSLIFVVVALQPIANWANYQNTCVTQESENAPISWAVRKCNGRSKVYQVK